MKLTNRLALATVILMTMVLIGAWGATRTVGVQASTWHVAVDSSDVTTEGSEANPFATIQHGIDVASHGDTVLVYPVTSIISFTRIITGDIVTDPAYSSYGCWGDYDNDGYLDLFKPNWFGQNNYLYHNNTDGTFEKITDGDIVNDGGSSRACTWGDYDNDGYPDLFVSNDGGGNFLYHNEGGTSFTRVLTGPIPQDGGNCYGSAWVDYDNDGWLDLFVARHTNANNLLYHNLGDGTFEKITAGDIVNDGGQSTEVAWGDYDDDGCPDLWVGNVGTQNDFLYHNNCDGTFSKIADGPIVIDGAFSGSGNWVDYDNDLDLDLFVGNWQGDNFLYQNNGDGSFASITSTLIVTEGLIHDSAWADLDNDGDLDLYMGSSNAVLHRLYRNEGDGTFVPILDVPVVEDPNSEAGLWGDYDNDGDLDLYVSRGGGYTNLLYRNETTGNHWINISLVGTVSNRSAIGARITIEALIDGVPVTQMREVSGVTGGNNQDSLNVEFGLGDATVIDSLVIEWPSGITQHWQGVAADQFMTIIESSESTFSISGRVTDAGGQGIPDVTISATGGYSTTTSASGAYALNNLLAGTYILTPTLEGYSFEPVTRTVTVPPDTTGQDFVGALLTHPILLYSTFLGGSQSDITHDTAIDSEGNVYIIGLTTSPDFPTTPDAYDGSYNGNMDAFLVKLSADGSTLLYSTYLGGSNEENGFGVALDGDGNIYVTGHTYSVDFPTTPGAMDQTLNGGRDAFVVKFSPAGEFIYSTYLGGDDWDYGKCIAVDGAGSAYVGGFTHGSFPVTPSAAQTSFGGSGDGFVVKLSPDGGSMVYGTYLGGWSWELINGIAVDSEGNAYLATSSPSADFPTTPGAYDTVCESCLAGIGSDAAATKLNADGSSFVYSTFVGGTHDGNENFYDVFVDSAGNAYFAGDSDADDFPTTPGAWQPVFHGGQKDAVVVKLNADGSDLVYSTYLGGAGSDLAQGIVLDNEGNAYVAGVTASTDFPTAFPWQPANGGGWDFFVAELNQDASDLLFGTYFGGSGDEYYEPQTLSCTGLELTSHGVVIAGPTASTDLPTTPGAYDESFNGGAYDAFVAHLGDNQPPVASAGPDQVVNRLAPVTLDGSGSTDPDGDLPLTYFWTQTGGPAVNFTPNLSVTTFTAPGDPAVLTFTLTVTDSLGLPDPTPDEVVITVTNPPVADAGPDQSVSTLASVMLDGSSSSDPDGDLPLAYWWTQTGGPAVMFTPQMSVTTFTAPGDPAVLTFTLTVTDSLGLPDPMPDEVVITVNNQPPVADAGPDQTVNTLSLVTLDGSGSTDPDDDLPLTCRWTQTGGPTVTLSDPTAVMPTFTAPGDPVVLTFTLTVTDSLGLPAIVPDEVVIAVQPYRVYLPLVMRGALSGGGMHGEMEGAAIYPQ